MRFAKTASCRCAAAIAATMISAFLVPTLAQAADFAPGTPVMVAAGEMIPVRTEPSWSAAAASEVAPGAWMDVVGGPYYDADGTPWYEVNAGGFVPASALGTDAPAEVGSEPASKEASYDAAQDDAAADPVEMAANGAPAEEAPVDAPVSENPTYDPNNVIATAWIAGTNGDGAVCRAGTDFASAEMGWLAEGQPVDVIGDTVGEWQPVNCGGSAAFIHASFITWEPLPTVDASGIDGENALPAAAPVETVATDVPVAEAAQTGNRNRGGNNGSNNDGGGANNSGSGQAMADLAMQYVGYPYVYAGEGPNAFDCSGFTMFVARKSLGMDITHDMFTQVGMGQSVSKRDLQPGDLVFFQNTFEPGLSHAGIYVGGGQFAHAENEGTGVVVSDINSDYYGSRWYGATRLT